MRIIRRAISCISAAIEPDDTPAETERKWRDAFIRGGALRAVNPDRVALMESLQGLDPDQAEQIYHAARRFMRTGIDAAAMLADTLQDVSATPDALSEDAIEAKLREIVETGQGRAPLDGPHVAAMVDLPTRGWLLERCLDLDAELSGYPHVPAPSDSEPLGMPVELVLSDEERARLDFVRWRVLRGEITE